MSTFTLEQLQLLSAVSVALQSELEMVQNNVLIWEIVTVDLENKTISFDLDMYSERQDINPAYDVYDNIQDVCETYGYELIDVSIEN